MFYTNKTRKKLYSQIYSTGLAFDMSTYSYNAYMHIFYAHIKFAQILRNQNMHRAIRQHSHYQELNKYQKYVAGWADKP